MVNITVNGKNIDKYFTRPVLQMIVNQPLDVIQSIGGYEIKATVSGGGLSGQAGAIRHGISRALLLAMEDSRGALKKEGMLTRDSRKVERKKYGQPGSRKKYQYSKR